MQQTSLTCGRVNRRTRSKGPKSAKDVSCWKIGQPAAYFYFLNCCLSYKPGHPRQPYANAFLLPAVLPSQVKAVEIDAPGCSYNPDPEDHQDAVAEAVAAEMSKQYAEEMLPKPMKVLRMPEIDELDALLVCQLYSSCTDAG